MILKLIILNNYEIFLGVIMQFHIPIFKILYFSYVITRLETCQILNAFFDRNGSWKNSNPAKMHWSLKNVYQHMQELTRITNNSVLNFIRLFFCWEIKTKPFYHWQKLHEYMQGHIWRRSKDYTGTKPMQYTE